MTSCYDAFNEIVEDFKHLLDRREQSIRQVEESLSENLLDESNVIRRLEHQIAVLRRDLLASSHSSEVTHMCSNCHKPLVHDQYSREILAYLTASDKHKNKKNDINSVKKMTFDSLDTSQHDKDDFYLKAATSDHSDYGQRWNPKEKADHPIYSHPFVPSSPHFESSTSSEHSETCNSSSHDGFRRLVSFNQFVSVRNNDADDDLEKRMMLLNDKVDRVTSKTQKMLNRSSHLNSSSQVLRGQITALQQDLRTINQNLQ